MNRAFLFVALIALAGCTESDSPTEPTPSSASLSGIVTDDARHGPVAGAEIVLHSNYSSPSTITTATDGAYTFTDLRSGIFEVTIRPPDRPAVSGGWVQLFGGANHHDFSIPGGATCLAPYGLVRDARSGKPLEGARVTIWTRSVRTDSEGRYRIDFGCGEHAGSSIEIRVERNGYKTLSQIYRVSFLCTCPFDFALDPA